MAIYIYDFEDSYKEIINKTYNAFEKYFNLKSKIDVDITCVDDDEIRRVNKESRNVDNVTDVLSFPTTNRIIFPFKKQDYSDFLNPETKRIMIGEIIVCINKILEQAEEYGHSKERELSYLTVHGLLHLLGYDHIDENDKKIMRQKEEEILSLSEIIKENA
jgi:probable rRNA maturation factor